MLTALSIKNYALIDDLKVDFPEGFIIITGETGSGKSIMLDALSLILGKRADMSALRNKEEKCIIEAEFSLQNYEFQSLFQELDIDYDPQTIIRREILPSGKSRAFVNDVPATLEVLSRLGQVLVDIHSQHQTLALSDTSFQFAIIDAMANNKSLLTEYVQLHQLLKKEQKKLEELIEFQKNAKKEYDYNLHQLKELKNSKSPKAYYFDTYEYTRYFPENEFIHFFITKKNNKNAFSNNTIKKYLNGEILVPELEMNLSDYNCIGFLDIVETKVFIFRNINQYPSTILSSKGTGKEVGLNYSLVGILKSAVYKSLKDRNFLEFAVGLVTFAQGKLKI